jgi:hypothetical protein
MFYKYNKESLIWEKDWRKLKTFLGIVFFLLVSSFICGRYIKFKSLDKYEKELIILNIQADKNKFNKEKLVDELKRLNVRFPHIVMAQSIVETGHWTSKVFRESNNLFGMREAKSRISTAKGTQFNHAYYNNWQESVYDYAFFQCRYMGNINTEEEYYAYLGNSYAENPDYVKIIKLTIEKENLKELFK